MQLLGTLTSPYTRKVRLVLLEKNIAHTFLLDAPSDPASQVATANPLGRVPALLLDDGTCLFDSPVIAEYLDHLNDTPVLLPHDFAARIRVKRWEALADGIMDSAVVVRTEMIRAPEKQSAEMMALHNDNITRTLAYVAQQLGQRPWCEGNAITLGDLALVSALIYLDLRQAERDWRGAHPDLAAWFTRISARNSVRIAMDA